MNIGKTGIAGENAAAAALKKKGYKILERNYVTPFGEIDIIAQQGETLVFVEVKTRSAGAIAPPVCAVNFAKRRKICRSAAVYTAGNSNNFYKRFDIIEVYVREKGKTYIRHIRDAFSYI